MNSRRAVVLFNLGGPDNLASVRPFLFNLFNDPAIIRKNRLVRRLLATLIAWRRSRTARVTYYRLGGRSPLLEQTWAQADALSAALDDADTKVFVCMRHWHPMTEEVVDTVARFDPDEIILLPLYPQFSSSTTASSMRAWQHSSADRLNAPVKTICCYPDEDGFIETVTANLEAALADWTGPAPRILYSAHGVPVAFIQAGDPYQVQVEATVTALRARLGRDDLDQILCYQSRVGPLAWLGPYTEDQIARAGGERQGLVIVPIAFVSEHAETLVELDQDYRALAERAGVPRYVRVATVGTDPGFIGALARLVGLASNRPAGVGSASNAWVCPLACLDCPSGSGGLSRDAA